MSDHAALATVLRALDEAARLDDEADPAIWAHAKEAARALASQLAEAERVREAAVQDTAFYRRLLVDERVCLAEVERERDHWHDEYVAACKSLTKRVHQGADAVHRAEAAEARLAEAREALEAEEVRLHHLIEECREEGARTEANTYEHRLAGIMFARDALARLDAYLHSTPGGTR